MAFLQKRIFCCSSVAWTLRRFKTFDVETNKKRKGCFLNGECHGIVNGEDVCSTIIPHMGMFQSFSQNLAASFTSNCASYLSTIIP